MLRGDAVTLAGTDGSLIKPPQQPGPDAAAPALSGPLADTQPTSAANPMRPMAAPAPRGPLSAALIRLLTRRRLASLDRVDAAVTGLLARTTDALTDGDLQLSLFLLYELHYGGVEDVPDSWEWEPKLLEVRRGLERAFELALRNRVPAPEPAHGVAEDLAQLIAPVETPKLADFMEHVATAEQVREVLACRSLAALHEADPHTWAIPRLHGAAKAVLVEIQSERYGDGAPGRMHAADFARCLRGAGLDDRYGAYADHVPTAVYTALNTMTLFGLHRRLRGACVGHLAAFESTWTLPYRACANGLRRLGFGDEVASYFEDHADADAAREQLAMHELAGALAEAEPELTRDILFGAAAELYIDSRLWSGILAQFRAGDSALRRPLG